jgi:periplasmic divalent cation tolerance protein
LAKGIVGNKIKGRTDRFPRLREFVLAQRPYELPELVRLDIADGNPAYLAWLRDNSG